MAFFHFPWELSADDVSRPLQQVERSGRLEQFMADVVCGQGGRDHAERGAGLRFAVLHGQRDDGVPADVRERRRRLLRPVWPSADKQRQFRSLWVCDRTGDFDVQVEGVRQRLQGLPDILCRQRNGDVGMGWLRGLARREG